MSLSPSLTHSQSLSRNLLILNRCQETERRRKKERQKEGERETERRRGRQREEEEERKVERRKEKFKIGREEEWVESLRHETCSNNNKITKKGNRMNRCCH